MNLSKTKITTRQLFFILCCGLILFSFSTTRAQINAITETGDQVVLLPDGTWRYQDENAASADEIPVNDKKFVKDESSTFLVKSKKLNIGIWIDPKKWLFSKGTDSDAHEFQFDMKGEDLYGMIVSEKVQIPIETLKGIALENARGVAPDIRIVREEYRNVNGLDVLMMQMDGTIQGMKFVYYGYYYSNEEGTIQFLTYTGKNLFDEYKEEIEIFLNGLTEVE